MLVNWNVLRVVFGILSGMCGDIYLGMNNNDEEFYLGEWIGFYIFGNVYMVRFGGNVIYFDDYL